MDTPVHSIHTSERLSYRGCRRRWAWIFRQGYYPKTTPKYFEFGIAYHLAMEVYYNPDTWHLVEAGGSQREAVCMTAIAEFGAKTRSQKLKYLRNSGQECLTPEEEEDYAQRLELGRGMLKYYFSLSPELDKFTPIQTEVSFEVPIVNPLTGEKLQCHDVNCYKHRGHAPVDVTYGGRIDLLAEGYDGGVYIFDWKTAARVDHEALLHLELDDQVVSYPWAMRELGVDIQGFIYHQQKKGYPCPPNENNARRQGRLFSVNKQQDTDFETYLNHVRKYDRAAFLEGLYDDFLEHLRVEGTRFYNRVEVHKSREELDSAALNIFYEAQEMINPSLPLYPSMGRMTCGSCAFREPCIGMNQGEDYQYTLDTLFDVQAPYWETNRESDSDKRF